MKAPTTQAQWVVAWGKSLGWIKGLSVYLQAGETQSELIPGLLLHFRAFIWACSRPSGFGGQWLLGNMGAALCFPAAPPTPPRRRPSPSHHFLWSKEGPGILLRGATYSEILGPVATGAGQGTELSGLTPTRGLPVGAAHGGPAQVGLNF